MKTSAVVSKDNVGKILAQALDAAGGLLRLTPTWVPRSFLHPGKPHQAAPRRLLRLRRQPRRHRRTLVRQHHRSGQRRSRARRRPQLRRLRRPAISRCATPSPKPAPRSSASAMFEQVQEVARLLEVLRQHGPDSAPHAPEFQSTPRWSARRASPRATTSRRSYNNVDNNFAYTFMGLEPGTTKDQLRKCLENWDKGDNGILDLSRAYRLQARHRLADSARRAARPRLALHLRAAMGQRRVRHVPEHRRRPRCALVAAGQRHAQGEAPGPRLHHRPARLGEERRYALQGAQLPGADRRS